MPEKYDFLATALDPLLSEIKELMALKMVQVDRKSYELEFHIRRRFEGNEPTLLMLSLTLHFIMLYSFSSYCGGLPRTTLSIPAFGVWYHQVTGVLSPRTSGASCGFIHMYMYLVLDYRYELPD